MPNIYSKTKKKDEDDDSGVPLPRLQCLLFQRGTGSDDRHRDILGGPATKWDGFCLK